MTSGTDLRCSFPLVLSAPHCRPWLVRRLASSIWHGAALGDSGQAASLPSLRRAEPRSCSLPHRALRCAPPLPSGHRVFASVTKKFSATPPASTAIRRCRCRSFSRRLACGRGQAQAPLPALACSVQHGPPFVFFRALPSSGPAEAERIQPAQRMRGRRNLRRTDRGQGSTSALGFELLVMLPLEPRNDNLAQLTTLCQRQHESDMTSAVSAIHQ